MVLFLAARLGGRLSLLCWRHGFVLIEWVVKLRVEKVKGDKRQKGMK